MRLAIKNLFWSILKDWTALITSEDIPDNTVYTERNIKLVDGVAVIDISGVIMRDEDGFAEFFGGASTERISRQIVESLASNEVKSILLYINSPGGQVNGTAELADQIFKARSIKPINAFISGDGYSAAYWIASQASKVYMSSAAGAGAIGVCYPVEKENYTEWLVSSVSPNKKPEVADEASRAQMQVMLDDLGEIFVDAVARGRGVNDSVVASRFGGGDIFIASKAVEKGLADEVMSFEKALEITKNAIIQKQENEDIMGKQPTPSAEMVETTDITIDWLKTNLPELYDEIVNTAKDQETARQAELDGMTPMNDEEKQAISAARKDRKITAQALSYDLRIKAQEKEKAKIAAIASARSEDSGAVIVPPTPEQSPKLTDHEAKVKAAMEAKAGKKVGT